MLHCKRTAKVNDLASIVAPAHTEALAGSRKAASVLMRLHADHVAVVLSLFSTTEAEEITAEMIRCGAVAPSRLAASVPSA